MMSAGQDLLIVRSLILTGLLIFGGFTFQLESRAQNVINIKPGKYEIDSKTRTSFDNSLSKKTEERCIQGNKLSPEVFLPNRENCTISNLKDKGNGASYDMTCRTPDGVALTGHVEYQAQETSFNYKLQLKGPFQDKQIEINAEGKAKWVGDC